MGRFGEILAKEDIKFWIRRPAGIDDTTRTHPFGQHPPAPVPPSSRSQGDTDPPRSRSRARTQQSAGDRAYPPYSCLVLPLTLLSNHIHGASTGNFPQGCYSIAPLASNVLKLPPRREEFSTAALASQSRRPISIFCLGFLYVSAHPQLVHVWYQSCVHLRDASNVRCTSPPRTTRIKRVSVEYK